jgi:pyridoxamine 5'-phosphate oxidase
MPIDQMRKSYQLSDLSEQEVHANPLIQFQQWFDQAATGEVPSWLEINAMTLSTVGSDLRVTSRIVLLKGFDDAGRFLFFTSYTSAKAKQLAVNSEVALCFHWPHRERQVRICGYTDKTPRESSVAYFQSRPRGSQLGVLVSNQSTTIANRDVLDQAYASLEAEYSGREIPCPEHWGGYAVTATEIEFWQGRDNRLHDRIVYRLSDGQWTISRLAP